MNQASNNSPGSKPEASALAARNKRAKWGGKKNKFWRPKGRALDKQARAEIEALLFGQAKKRDLLIEYLHQIQDAYACLHVAHLHALAAWLNIAPVEVYEVASFYHHFDLLHDGETPPAKLTVRVCDSISCMLAGSEDLIDELSSLEGDDIRVQRVPCVGQCDRAPVAVVGQNVQVSANFEQVKQAAVAGDTQAAAVPWHSGALSVADNGIDHYAQYQACRSGERSVDEVIQTLEEANLRGLGGAGFPAGRKWQILRQQAKPRWVAVNLDEGEPGTFKDRVLLEQQPHALLAGLLIAAWAIDSQQCVIYVRDEYPAICQALVTAIAALPSRLGGELPNIQVRRGAGAYICGEESAMLESIEGKRGLPRHRPPYIAEVGLFGCPTLEHNAETLIWVPELLSKGADWFQSQGSNGRKGLRRFSLSGRINKPGVYLAPAGISVTELINEYGDGMLPEHDLYGYLPGGASGGILPASLSDIPLDFDTLQAHGCFIGSAAVIVFSQQDKARDIALNAMRFFAHESCGQCTPCRVGTAQAVEMMDEKNWPQQALSDLAEVMLDASICGLGQAAPNPMLSVMKYFPHEIGNGGEP